ncbi:MAG: hypothetical protein ACYDEN_11380, partial [Acidimicrobiales bacterium]
MLNDLILAGSSAAGFVVIAGGTYGIARTRQRRRADAARRPPEASRPAPVEAPPEEETVVVAPERPRLRDRLGQTRSLL